MGKINSKKLNSGLQNTIQTINNIAGSKYNSVSPNIREEDEIVRSTIGTYPLSSMKYILHNGQPTGDNVRNIFEGIISI